MNKEKHSKGLDNLISLILKKTNIYLEATEDNQVRVYLSEDKPLNSALVCSIKEFIKNDWSLMGENNE